MIMCLSTERIQWSKQNMFQFKDGIYIFWIGIKPFINIYKPEFLEVRIKKSC